MRNEREKKDREKKSGAESARRSEAGSLDEIKKKERERETRVEKFRIRVPYDGGSV